jgi:hypothetical protein
MSGGCGDAAAVDPASGCGSIHRMRPCRFRLPSVHQQLARLSMIGSCLIEFMLVAARQGEIVVSRANIGVNGDGPLKSAMARSTSPMLRQAMPRWTSALASLGLILSA